MNQYDFSEESPTPQEIISYLDKIRGDVMKIYSTTKVNTLKEEKEDYRFSVLSTGEPGTLKTYRKIALALGGEDSQAVQFFDQKIAEQGEDEPVLADERQMIQLILQMVSKEQEERNASDED